MKPKNAFLGLSILWLVIALALSVVIWKDVSLPAKISFFALGFASGISLGVWLSKRSKQ
jgi:hypothetical protein